MTESHSSPSARGLLGSELRRLREIERLSQAELAERIHHSRALLSMVELGERWPPHDLVLRCDETLRAGGALTRLWPLIEHERLAAQRTFDDASVGDIREAVRRLAALTGTDLHALPACSGEGTAEAGGQGSSSPPSQRPAADQERALEP